MQKQFFEIDQNWKFRQAGKSDWNPAVVPGTVHTDLLANGAVDDPFFRTNEFEQQWIDKEDWEYSTEIDISEAVANSDNVELFFAGLDTYADVYFNDTLVLSSNNMFLSWRVSVKELVRPGKNQLRLFFHSPMKTALPMLEANEFPLPAVNDQSENGQMGDKKVSIFTRKAPYHYGWDWGPRFVTSGIWRPITLEAWDNVRIENIYYIQKAVSAKSAEITARFELASAISGEAVVSVETGQHTHKKTAMLSEGINTVELDFIIKNPKLWWSNGLGEAFRYTFSATVSVDNAIVDQQEDRIGLRSLRLVREKDDVGTSFYFELNGTPVFAKGANYIPNDNFLTRVSDEKYHMIVKAAADANMNMLRVWGGGIYENDIFYDLCDQYGILIWQDFMFACSLYPGDDEFVENVKVEIAENIRRLRNHACIALWCGNNEIDAAISYNTEGGEEWKKEYNQAQLDKMWQDYQHMFLEVVPEVVKANTWNGDYWPSSPQADWDTSATYESTSGDIHYWGVWHGLEPFENFKKYVGRFMSEYGFQSFPELATVKKYALPEDYDIDSKVMAAHQRSGIGNQRIREYMLRDYHEPAEFEDFLWVSQVMQADGIKSAIEAHRRRMPYCMGTLYWQLNDCWPVASWASMDYHGRWKALHYFAKKAYDQLLVSPTIDDDQVNVFLVSDSLNPVQGKLVVELLDFYGLVISEETFSVTLNPGTSEVAYSVAKSELLGTVAPQDVVLRTSLLVKEEIVSENLLYFSLVKELNLPVPEVSVELEENAAGFILFLETDKLAKNVYLSLEDGDGFFSDNFFDLLPNETVAVEFITTMSPDDFAENLQLVTLADTL